ncbi:MAG: hypothetical protein ACRD4V_03430 [Candidatus Acidiferrales bacterium]
MTNNLAATSATTVTQGARYLRLPIVLMFLGALSSFITTAWDAASRWSVFEGVVFGVAVVCGLAAFKIVTNPMKAAALIVFSPFAFYAAYFASFVTQLMLSGLGLLSESEEATMGHVASPSPIALFIGGLVGGFVLVGAVLWLVSEGNRHARRALLWSVASGILAVIGWALSPLLGPALSHVIRILRPDEAWLTPQSGTPNGPLGMICSVFFVWQTSMAFAIGLMVQTKNQVSNQEKPQ